MTAAHTASDNAWPAAPADDLSVLDDPLEQARFTRWSEAADGARVGDSSLRISGMHCAACAGLIEQAVRRVDGVLEASVSAAGERARIRWDARRVRLPQIVQAIRGAGYDAVPDVALAAREQRRSEHRTALWRLFVAAFCAMQVMMMATPSYVTSGNELAPDMRSLLNWGSWILSLPVMAFSAGPFFSGAWRSLRQRRIGMDVPVALGLLVTFVASSGATFHPAGPFGHEVYFDSLTMFLSFLLGGRYLELRARHRAAQQLEDATATLPQTALRLDEAGRAERVSVQRLAVGDRVRVPVGEAFPADGRLVEGETRADEALLSGESTPVAKALGALVVAGSVNVGAPVVVRLDRVGADTRLEAIVAMMREAMSQRPALARAADRWAGPFLWTVLLLAAGAAAAWSLVDPHKAVWVAVSVLIVTCPCALSLAAPSALLAVAGAMARRGVLVQRLDGLEALAGAQRVVFDKTGTLTEDRLQLLALVRLDDAAPPDAQLRAAARALAACSTHPLSQALQEALADEAAPWPLTQVTDTPGAGLAAVDAQGRRWTLGSATHAGAAGAQAPGAAVWLGLAGRAVARFDLDETLRPDAQAAVRELRAQGLAVTVLSGDRPERAQRMGERLGADEAIGGATPDSKLAHVRAAQARGERVVMVGDGVNDAPVLAAADAAIAMGQGAVVARSSADAVIVSGRLADVPWARERARAALRVVRQNITWAAAYNLACIPLALAGWLPPWAAGLGMATSSLLVIGNSLRLARPESRRG